MSDTSDDDEPFWKKFATDEAVAATRATVIERMRTIARTFATTPVHVNIGFHDGATRYAATTTPLRSYLLWAGQYWSDNAEDEVHLKYSASSSDTPEWPHACREVVTDPLEVCNSCGRELPGSYDWGYGELIPAFEAFCHEGANQDMDYAESHRPIARFVLAGDDVTVELEPVVRAWLDRWQTPLGELPGLPDRVRALVRDIREPGVIEVLGDALQELAPDDPRAHGEGRAWLGSFDRYVPRSGLRLVEGVPSEIALYVDGEVDRDTDLPWRFAPRVRFCPGSSREVWPALAACRALGPLDAIGLRQLAALPDVAVEELALHDMFASDVAWISKLPRLRRLELVGIELSWVAPWVRGLEAVELGVDASELERAVRRAQELALPIPVTVGMIDRASERIAGWTATVHAGRIAIARRGYHAEATPEVIAGLR